MNSFGVSPNQGGEETKVPGKAVWGSNTKQTRYKRHNPSQLWGQIVHLEVEPASEGSNVIISSSGEKQFGQRQVVDVSLSNESNRGFFFCSPRYELMLFARTWPWLLAKRGDLYTVPFFCSSGFGLPWLLINISICILVHCDQMLCGNVSHKQ